MQTRTIDITNMSAEDAAILYQWISANPDRNFFESHNGWGNQQVYHVGMPVGGFFNKLLNVTETVSFKISHNFARYQSHSEEKKGRSRFAVYGNEVFGKGGQAQVYLSDASLSLDEKKQTVNYKHKSEEKVRVFRVFTRNDYLENSHDNASNESRVMASLPYSMFHQKNAVLSHARRDRKAGIVMRKLSGQELYDIMDKERDYDDNDQPKEAVIMFNIRQRIQLSLMLAEALKRVHEAGIVHRDVSLSNFLVELDAENNPVSVTLFDFGLSKLKVTQDLDFCGGTLECVAPEVWLKAGTTEKSDIFSLGKVLLFLWQPVISNQTGEKDRHEEDIGKLFKLISNMANSNASPRILLMLSALTRGRFDISGLRDERPELGTVIESLKEIQQSINTNAYEASAKKVKVDDQEQQKLRF